MIMIRNIPSLGMASGSKESLLILARLVKQEERVMIPGGNIMKRGGFAFLIAILVVLFCSLWPRKSQLTWRLIRDIATRSFGAFSLDSYLIHQLGLAKGVTEEI